MPSPDAPDNQPGVEVDQRGFPIKGRRRYRYDVREFKIEDGKYHECTGQVVAVLGAVRSEQRGAWYVTVLVRRDQIVPGLTPGEGMFDN